MRDHAYAGSKCGVGTNQDETVITKLGNLAMGRQIGVKYGCKQMVQPVQYPGMGEYLSKTGTAVLHQRLNAFELAARFI